MALHRDFRMIEIRFCYAPHRVDVEELPRAQRELTFPKWSLGEKPDRETQAPEQPEYRNVLMLSVEDADGIRGMTHMHTAEQRHCIGVGGLTTEGFRPGMVPKGCLCIVISVFSIWSEGCAYTLEVYGEPLKERAWYPFELHSHTVHSDGTQTVEELTQQAAALGYRGLALTDHNTVSGQREWHRAGRKSALVRIDGMEWTTFYGHILFLNCREYLDWRGLTRQNLTQTLREVRKRHPHMLVGIAHPLICGGIGCAGCGFEFELEDWAPIDYLEVWSKTYAGNKKSNEAAYRLWTRLLDSGLRIVAVAGGDWHAPLKEMNGLSATYLCAPAEQQDPDACLAALRAGCAVVSTGPVPILELYDSAGDATYGIGSEMPGGLTAVLARIGVSEGLVSGCRARQPGDVLALESNGGTLWRGRCPDGTAQISLDINGICWMRLALYDESNSLIAFTNAVYREAQQPGTAAISGFACGGRDAAGERAGTDEEGAIWAGSD
jgi:hypothetical protein